ncbi:VWA domain-containing protein [Candidatus Woesearchaeota archaeon]|nr:VWA domain-containing protein [Candidatus Woesearchaeota archaeon]
MKKVVTGNVGISVKEFSKAEELSGGLEKQNEEDKLMHSVLQADKDAIDDGKIISDSINQGLNSFTPDLMFDKIVSNYSLAKQLFGESIIRAIAGYDPRYIERNIKIPEFQRELKEKKLVDDEGAISDKGIELASLVLYTEELDNLMPKGILGEKIHKKQFIYGDAEDVESYKRGARYRDLAIKKTVKTAIRRSHDSIDEKDLKIFGRKARGSVYIIYGLDSSGSMKGKKIEIAKKAGIALAYKAINEKDKVGLIAFGTELKAVVAPTADFLMLIKEITKVRASMETNITATIKKAVELFSVKNATKHLILLTDALPTVGKNPEEEVLEAVSLARSNNITISIIGIGLDNKGKELAGRIAEIGEGRVYVVKDLEKLDKIILEEYYSLI